MLNELYLTYLEFLKLFHKLLILQLGEESNIKCYPNLQ